jgi:hypothetical protein
LSTVKHTCLLPLALCLAAVALSAACGRRPGADLTARDAAAQLRASPAFAAGADESATRELVEITALRRLGSSSTEVEFTWRATPVSPVPASAPLKTSMALFRLDDRGRWALASLYKVK